MRLITFSNAASRAAVGVLLERHVLELSAAKPDEPALRTMLDLIDAGPAGLAVVRDLVGRVREGDEQACRHLQPLKDVRILAPIPRPRKNVICVGLNYRSHVEQNARAHGMRFELPERPLFFSKPVTAVIGPGDGITHDPRLTQQLDYEIELGIVIGRRGTWIPANEALEYVFGYTLINEVSARDIQARSSQFFIAKGLDTYCPIGPAIVERDSLPDPCAIDLVLRVNGDVRQRESTAGMLFDVPHIIEEVSRGMTLEPGDIIATGTPGGCGYQMEPPVFLQPGDAVECFAEPIGVLSNTVVAAHIPARPA